MAEIRETISLSDRFTPVIDKITEKLDRLSVMFTASNNKAEEFSKVHLRTTSSVKQSTLAFDAFTQLQRLYASSVEFSRYSTDGLASAMKNLQRATNSNRRPMDNMMKDLKKMDRHFSSVGIRSLMFGVTAGDMLINFMHRLTEIPGKILDVGDSYILTMGKMTIATNSQSEALRANDLVYRAAQRARADFGYMGTTVARIGVAAGRYFKNTDELVKFTETVAKSFTVAGATSEMQRASTLQLVQALGSNRLQGDEFRSISEGAPLILNALEKFTGIERGMLKKAGSKGMITSDILKGAVLAYSKEIDEQFNQMPVTFEQAMTKLTNKFVYSFGPIFAEISTSVGSMITYIADHMWEIFEILTAISMVLTVAIIPSIYRLIVATAMWVASLMGSLVILAMAHPIIGLIIVAAVVLFRIFITTRYEFMNMIGAVAQWIGNIQNFIIDLIIKFEQLVNKAILFNNVIANIMGTKTKLDFVNFGFSEKDKWNPNEMRWNAYIATGKAFDKIEQLKQKLEDTGKGWKDIISGDYNADGVPVNVKGGKLDKVKIYDEDLVLLKDLALREFKLSFSQVTPVVQMTFGDVHHNVDIEEAAKVVKEKLIESIEEDLGGVPSHA